MGDLATARGRTDCDEARVRQECVEVLADLPLEVSEPAAKDALEPTVTEACGEIEQRQAEKERQAKKAERVRQGVEEAATYSLELKAEGEIDDEDYWDTELRTELKEAVRRTLEADLSGDETTKGSPQAGPRNHRRQTESAEVLESPVFVVVLSAALIAARFDRPCYRKL